MQAPTDDRRAGCDATRDSPIGTIHTPTHGDTPLIRFEPRLCAPHAVNALPGFGVGWLGWLASCFFWLLCLFRLCCSLFAVRRFPFRYSACLGAAGAGLVVPGVPAVTDWSDLSDCFDWRESGSGANFPALRLPSPSFLLRSRLKYARPDTCLWSTTCCVAISSFSCSSLLAICVAPA